MRFWTSQTFVRDSHVFTFFVFDDQKKNSCPDLKNVFVGGTETNLKPSKAGVVMKGPVSN